MDFKFWLEETEKLIPVQDTDQKYDYDCGPGALRAISSYFGIDKDQKDLISLCDAGKRKGTHPDDLVKCAKKLSLSAKMQMNMTLDELLGHLRQGHPVICAIQAWGEENKDVEYRQLKSGHYVVAIGFDSKKIIFEDPSMKGTRGTLKYKEFMKRWYDRESYQRHGSGYTPHLGIVVVGPNPKNPNPQKKTKPIP
jgi:predicted double-glycine peptidase